MKKIEKELRKTGIPAVDALLHKYASEDRVWGDVPRPLGNRAMRPTEVTGEEAVPSIISGDSGAASSALLRVVVLGAAVTLAWYAYGQVKTLTGPGPAAEAPARQRAAVGTAPADVKSLTGTWQGSDGPGGILLSLRQTNGVVTGWHCASYATPGPNPEIKSDCPAEDIRRQTLTGTVVGSTADVTYTTWTGTGRGRAHLARQGDTLIWLLLEAPAGAYAPSSTVLQLSSVTPLP